MRTLEPFYERAEWELGAAGDGDTIQIEIPRKRNYPLPPVPPNPQTVALQNAARQLGWVTTPVPLLINTESLWRASGMYRVQVLRRLCVSD